MYRVKSPVEDICPHCQVVGDFYGVPEFVPARMRCGNCLTVYIYVPSVWERLDREPFEGHANDVYLRPRWRTPRTKFTVAFNFNANSDTSLSIIVGNPQDRIQASKDEARAFLARFPVKQLIYMLRSSDYYGPRWEDLKAVLGQKPHVEFDRRNRSAHRRTLARQNHGMSKSKDR